MGKTLKTILPIAGLVLGAIFLPEITFGGLALFGASAGAAIGGLAGTLLSSTIKVKPSGPSPAQLPAFHLGYDE